MKRRLDFWDILLIIVAFSIFGWALLKSVGILHSPVWVEMIPYLSGGIGILGVVYKLGKIKQGIDETKFKVNKILSIEQKFNKLENEHNLAMQGKLKFKH